MSPKLKLSTPAGGSFREGICSYYSSGKTRLAKTIVIEPAEPSDITYGVWLGSAEVTLANKDDILGDGEAQYDTATNTLTLNDPHIFGSYSKAGFTHKIYSDHDLTLKGSYQMTSDTEDYGLDCYGSLTLDGEFTFLGGLYGVHALNDIDVAGGSLTAKSSSAAFADSAGIYSHNGMIVIGDSVTRVEAQGKKIYAIYADRGLTIPDHLYVTEPASSKVTKNTVVDSVTGGDVIAKRVVISINTYAEYDLWVGGTQVTSDNKDDILGDGGKAKYDPYTRTLTLNDPVIPDAPSSNDDYYYVIKAREIDLTVSGSYHMTGDEGYDYGINVYLGDLTLSGDFTFISKYVAVSTNSGNDLTIASGSLKAVTLASGNSVVICKNLTIAPGVTRVEAENSFGNGSAFYIYEAISIPDDLAIVYPSSASIDENGKLVSADGDRICHVLIAPTDTPVDIVANYPLWVSNIQVTSENKDDILGDGGRAKYDPDTKVLIFDEPELTDYYVVDKYNSALIYSEIKSLTIKGSWHMTSASEDGIIYASDNSLSRNCSLTFSGDFYLKAEGDNIFVDGDLTLASGSLTVEGQLYTSGKFIIEEAATGFEYTGDRLETDYGYVIPENLCIIEPAGGMVKGYYIYENDGVTKATHVVIGTPKPDGLLGDVDGDGEMSITDATFIQRWLAGLPSNDNIGKPIK